MKPQYEKEIAEESIKTRKVREKLKKQLESFDQKITAPALEKKLTEIHRWIERHASQRVVLKEKSISLFDENRNAAEFSQRVSTLVEKLKQDMQDIYSHQPPVQSSRLASDTQTEALGNTAS